MSVGSNNKHLMQISQSFFLLSVSLALSLFFLLSVYVKYLVGTTYRFACYQLEFYTFDNVIAHVRTSGSKGANQMIPLECHIL